MTDNISHGKGTTQAGESSELQYAKPDRDVLNAAMVLSATADITLVVDAKGVICDRPIAFNMPAVLMLEGWQGRSLFDVVTSECRPKVVKILTEPGEDGSMSWRHLNHQIPKSADVPVRYMAIPVGKNGHRILIGREMRDLANIQQSFIAAAQVLELERARARLVGSRLGRAFSASKQATLIMEAGTGRIVDANQVASQQFKGASEGLVGSNLFEILDEADRKALRKSIGQLLAAERSGQIDIRLDVVGDSYVAIATVFKWKERNFVILNLKKPAEQESAADLQAQPSASVQSLMQMQDGFVLVDFKGSIITANSSFLALAAITSEDAVRGQPLSIWLGEDKGASEELIGKLQKEGGIRDFRTMVRGELGRSSVVDVSGVKVDVPDLPCLALIVSKVSDAELGVDARTMELVRAKQGLPRLIGQATLKDVAGEAAARVERICIEAALAINNGNRTEAAAWLGLSRQSLYEKLERYGIGVLPHDTSG